MSFFHFRLNTRPTTLMCCLALFWSSQMHAEQEPLDEGQTPQDSSFALPIIQLSQSASSSASKQDAQEKLKQVWPHPRSQGGALYQFQRSQGDYRGQ